MGSPLSKAERSPSAKMERPSENAFVNVYETPDVQSITHTLNFPSSSAAESPTESLGNNKAFRRQSFPSIQNAERLDDDFCATSLQDEQTISKTVPFLLYSSNSEPALSKNKADDCHISSKRVKAISDYEANREDEINFKTGDIMEIIVDHSHDGYYSVKNTKSLKTGYVPANKVRKIIDEIEALEGFCDVDRETAEESLQEKGVEPGSYLIRPSNDKACYAFSVLCQNKDKCQVRHYKIKTSIVQNGKEMIERCSKHPILGNILTKPHSRYLNALKEVAIDINDINIGKKLGNGHFAAVYEGTLADTSTVAVKSLRPAGALSVHDFLEEAYVMHKLRHERLVALIGFCINPENSVYIVMEKMSKGALKDLLLKDRGEEIKFLNLMTMAIQIADGMSYLESQKFVHRDLRAANILVDDSYDVKIADFGLGRILDQYYEHVHFYIETKGTAFPFKWTAPEAVRTLQFTVKSDVWSFGILLYEIFTYGEEFYLGMSNREAVEWVVKGNRLEKPVGHHCPDTLYRLMQICWNEEPEERPTFQMMKTFLKFEDCRTPCTQVSNPTVASTQL